MWPLKYGFRVVLFVSVFVVVHQAAILHDAKQGKTYIDIYGKICTKSKSKHFVH